MTSKTCVCRFLQNLISNKQHFTVHGNNSNGAKQGPDQCLNPQPRGCADHKAAMI